MFQGMDTNANGSYESTTAPEIEALLSLSKSMSIFDGLLALPPVAGNASNEWDRAVNQRLQTRLVAAMRSRLERTDRADAA